MRAIYKEAWFNEVLGNVERTLTIDGERVFCREAPETRCRELGLRCDEDIDGYVKLEVYEDVRYFEETVTENAETEVKKGIAHYLAVWSSGKDDTFEFTTGDTWADLSDNMGLDFGFILYGQKPTHFKVHISGTELMELFEVMDWGRSPSYMSEWKERIESGNWVYDATQTTAEAMKSLGIITDELYEDYLMMEIWRRSKDCLNQREEIEEEVEKSVYMNGFSEWVDLTYKGITLDCDKRLYDDKRMDGWTDRDIFFYLYQEQSNRDEGLYHQCKEVTEHICDEVYEEWRKWEEPEGE